ncbi:hypothetical protein ABG768_016534 [Culter alburnus]|uniref:Uncharacterized protein n=1 Tax=Culter alburnus TaxID=194366 RepID=A0AAW1Z2Y2_CULAL
MADLILVDLLWEMPSVLLPKSKVGEVEKLEGGMHNLQVSGDVLQVCSSAGFRKERESATERDPIFPSPSVKGSQEVSRTSAGGGNMDWLG